MEGIGALHFDSSKHKTGSHQKKGACSALQDQQLPRRFTSQKGQSVAPDLPQPPLPSPGSPAEEQRRATVLHEVCACARIRSVYMCLSCICSDCVLHVRACSCLSAFVHLCSSAESSRRASARVLQHVCACA